MKSDNPGMARYEQVQTHIRATPRAWLITGAAGFIGSHLLETLRYPHLRDFRPVYREFRVGDVRFSQADIGKARRLLGYLPLVRVSEGLARAVDWYVASLSPQPPILGAVPGREPEGSGSPILNMALS